MLVDWEGKAGSDYETDEQLGVQRVWWNLQTALALIFQKAYRKWWNLFVEEKKKFVEKGLQTGVYTGRKMAAFGLLTDEGLDES